MSSEVGVIGSGAFGTTIAHLLSINQKVLLYTRKEETLRSINDDHKHLNLVLSPRIRSTMDKKEFCETCTLIFPVVPSEAFRVMIRSFSEHLKPYHILIHGTKGLDLKGIEWSDVSKKNISREQISTMSEVIIDETLVRRVGCLAGPNLAAEIQEGFPAATVIASKFEEVCNLGQEVLNSEQFFVFASKNIIGAELAGAFKNIIALGTGLIAGRGMGKNLEALLITRGLREIIYFGKAMGAESRSFLGTAGIGDLVATATSEKSRNFQVGMRIAKGEKLDTIIDSMDEVAEGVRTLKFARYLAMHYHIHVPITEMLYKVVYEEKDIAEAISFLMRYPYAADVDFL